MKNLEPIQDNEPCKNHNQLQSFKSGFVIPASFPCVIIKGEILKVGSTYHLADFGDKGEIYVRVVKFLNAYTKGNRIVIVVLDVDAGEMLSRSHRFNNNDLPCDWVLMDTDVFESKTDKKEILDYCERD